MEITQISAGRVAVLQVVGRFTATDRPGELKDAVSAVLRNGARHVLLDLSGVSYVDSTRLGELISAHITVTKQGGRLKLIAPPERIVSLLSMAGLDGVFEQFLTIELASATLD